MRLLSFLTYIEQALATQSDAVEGGAWETERMVNFHHGLARLTVRARSSGAGAAVGGAIFVQAFALADGSICLKASLNWKGSDALPVIAVYSTPALNWRLEAARIAAAWFAGPPAAGTIATTVLDSTEIPTLAAAAG
jgi:hypothetical protein